MMYSAKSHVCACMRVLAFASRAHNTVASARMTHSHTTVEYARHILGEVTS